LISYVRHNFGNRASNGAPLPAVFPSEKGYLINSLSLVGKKAKQPEGPVLKSVMSETTLREAGYR